MQVVGDTIQVVLEVLACDPRGDRPDGRVEFRYEITKTDGTVCIDGAWVMLIAKRDRPG